MNITKLQAQVARDEEGYPVTIYDPTGEPYLSKDGTPSTWSVTGTQAKAYRKAVDMLHRKVSKGLGQDRHGGRAARTPDRARRRRFRRLVGMGRRRGRAGAIHAGERARLSRGRRAHPRSSGVRDRAARRFFGICADELMDFMRWSTALSRPTDDGSTERAYAEASAARGNAESIARLQPPPCA
jgi:hypothetical protein